MARIIIVEYEHVPRSRREAALIARHAVAALLLSNNVRRDTVFIAFFAREKALLKISGATVRNLRADEESASGLLWSMVKKGIEYSSLPTPASCIVPANYYSICPPEKELCEKLRSPILISYSPKGEVNCDNLVPFPKTPSITHMIIQVNMVLDQCEKTSR